MYGELIVVPDEFVGRVFREVYPGWYGPTCGNWVGAPEKCSLTPLFSCNGSTAGVVYYPDWASSTYFADIEILSVATFKHLHIVPGNGVTLVMPGTGTPDPVSDVAGWFGHFQLFGENDRLDIRRFMRKKGYRTLILS
ncbi:hypothetical protein ACJU26_08765 [Acidithiobacillus sp. M4-SHS-6]|uniref:hypothetical protein n=1 Tax=Acidithiobacillus sp. M4-SHS-6 TaxID=3383024 RepID=UPI0039BE51B9